MAIPTMAAVMKVFWYPMVSHGVMPYPMAKEREFCN